MPSDREDRTVNQVLADNLAYFMAERGMKQAALAREAGIGQTTVSLYLNPDRRMAGKTGKEPSAKLAEVESLARALNVGLWELLRPLSPAQREFYKSMEALLQERAPQTAQPEPKPQPKPESVAPSGKRRRAA